MDFKQALAAKEKEIYAEYQMRAARITAWLLEQGEITEKESEEVYNELWNDISESEDEYDSLAMEVVERVRDRNKNKGAK